MALLAFAAVACATPGPNNTLLLASGMNHGLRRSLPFLAGIQLGLAGLVLACGAGLATLLAARPELERILAWAGAAYLAWLAWRIARSRPDGSDTTAAPPLRCREGAALQLLNPKAWGMALTGVALFAPAGGPALATLIGTFVVVGVPANLAWAAGGQWLARWQAQPARLRWLNRFFAAVLLLSALPALWR